MERKRIIHPDPRLVMTGKVVSDQTQAGIVVSVDGSFYRLVCHDVLLDGLR
jgi:hypothetical protein